MMRRLAGWARLGGARPDTTSGGNAGNGADGAGRGAAGAAGAAVAAGAAGNAGGNGSAMTSGMAGVAPGSDGPRSTGLAATSANSATATATDGAPSRPLAAMPAGNNQAPRPPASPALPSSRDAEFLPAALEILVTPPSPVKTRLIALIATMVVAGLAWSWFGRIDIHAVAQGRLQPSGRSKVVQPLEPGRVVAIHVENGTEVAADAVLVELDPTETTADREAMSRDLEAATAEAARRAAAVKAAATPELALVPMQFPDRVSEGVRRREEAVMTADLAQLKAQRMSLAGQLAEKQAARKRLEASIEARQRLIALSRERVSIRQQASDRGGLSRALIIDSLQALEQHLTTDAGERGQLLETDAAAAALQRRMDEAITQFTADQTQKLAEAERRRDRLEQELVKARAKSERTALRSPIAGTVQQLNVAGPGQVVVAGQSVLTVVPIDARVEAEALIANKDIGFVRPGQPAIVKVESFPFTRYGVIEAEVVKVSRDAVEDREATAMTDAAGAARPQGAAGPNASRTQNLVFPATIRLARRSIVVDGREVPLTPGMAVTVEVKTGQRRAIDFVLSPLSEVLSTWGRER